MRIHAIVEMASVQGHYDEKFKGVAAVFQCFLGNGEELGASITVDLDGKDVLNIWGGFADAEKTKPWDEDTVCCIFSTTKTISALAVLKLVDRGLIDIDEKVARYWPEFAANGKENIRVRHVLSHTAALPGWQKPVFSKMFAMWKRLQPCWRMILRKYRSSIYTVPHVDFFVNPGGLL